MGNLRTPTCTGFLVQLPAGAALPSRGLSIAGARADVEPLFEVGGGALRLNERPSTWVRVRHEVGSDPPWDLVHAEVSAQLRALAAGDAPAAFIEPDLEQSFLTDTGAAGSLRTLFAGGNGVADPPDPDFPIAAGLDWFLRTSYSDLGKARERARAAGGHVRIAHLDTGFDPAHVTLPRGLRRDLAHDLVDPAGDGRDPGAGGVIENPGHGPATLAILAGGRAGELGADLGGAPDAEVIPIRIATSVVLFRTSALAKALALAAGDGAAPPLADVVSLSMGGLASKAWADAVNQAYARGVTIVAAAGNNVATGLFGFPTRLIVYPARFRRVIAVCGVMANHQPYTGARPGKLQGNFGPASKMATAIAAFTPNMPWAELGQKELIDRNGQGTSCATPQVAAAAALWLQIHRARLDRYPERWMRVEAVRQALFASAMKDGASREKIGNGILRAAAALDVQPPDEPLATPPDTASLALLRLFTGLGVGAGAASTEQLALEAAQLVQIWDDVSRPNPFEELGVDLDLPRAEVPTKEARRIVEALIEHPRASRALRDALESRWPRTGPAPSTTRADASPSALEERARPARTPPTVASPAPPAHRRLRAYAFDPSLATRLDTAAISEVTIRVPWEPLAAGPVGEYLEVIDVDPATGCFCAPVELDRPELLAQDGLPPSEGTPQFHQQMVYAVASQTIGHFERALGRRALWAPGPPLDRDRKKKDDEHDDFNFVRRLRMYPHALREANAYYSPAKKAILFGYYRASSDAPGEHPAGAMVFTCLSHDIIAHETAHALLDGLHRRFVFPTNPDLRAFHEAFADLVAIFQHFTFPDVLEPQIAATRGDIRSHENLLGQLAVEFGRTTGARGALRDAIGRTVDGKWVPHEARPTDYESATEEHARGAVLLAAVFSAFLSIYERRTKDLLRLASGGTGRLPDGAIHPDLVGRLSQEARKTADHVLSMCIRALDYCPPIDLTFGEYLRALITADRDLIEDDDLQYRVAFIEAFRRRGIYPRDVRTLSVESLLWCGGDDGGRTPPPWVTNVLERVRERADAHAYAKTRKDLFYLGRKMRLDLHHEIREHLQRSRDDGEYFGIDGHQDSFEVHSARIAHRVGPDGNVVRQLIFEILQRDGDAGGLPFEGGSTVIADLRDARVRYCIRKRVQSQTRRARQVAHLTGSEGTSLRATYLAEVGPASSREPFAFVHRSV